MTSNWFEAAVLHDVAAVGPDLWMPALSGLVGLLALAALQLGRDNVRLRRALHGRDAAREASERTHLKRERELEARTRELQAMRDTAELASRARSSFIANMSFELRVRLNAIIGYGEILLEDAENAGRDDQAEDVRKVCLAGKQVLELVTEILEVFGVAIVGESGHELDQLLAKAALALSQARDHGLHAVPRASSGRDIAPDRRQGPEEELRRALEEGEFELHYQPLVSLAEQRIIGSEALIRWRHPVQGLRSPADFIPLAEESGLITPIGAWVLHAACREAAGWPGHAKVAVNVSPVQFKTGDFIGTVAEALAATGLEPGRLEIEITESVLIENRDRALQIFGELRRLGVRISLDDFGSGYSSLAYLKKFTFDKIKIDRSFISDLGANAEAPTIVRAILSLSAGLGISALAEGVETGRQEMWLRAEGCAEAQGYLFGRPQPAAAMRALLRDSAGPSSGRRALLPVGTEEPCGLLLSPG